MHKLIISFATIVVITALTGCVQEDQKEPINEPPKPDTTTGESKIEATQPEEKLEKEVSAETKAETNTEEKTPVKTQNEEYFISENSLWHKDQKIMDLWENQEFRKDNAEDYGEWFRREDKNNLYIYLSASAGCGGCLWKKTEYLVVNKNSGDVKMANLNLYARMEGRGTVINISPDKTKGAFTSPRSLDDPKQWVDMYNFVSNKVEATTKIPENQTVLSCDAWSCEFQDKAISWDYKNGDFIVNPQPEASENNE